MRTVVLAGVPAKERRKAVSRLQQSGACVLHAPSVRRAAEHLEAGTVDALVLDIGLLARSDGEFPALLREARRRRVLVIGVGVFPVVDGLRLSAQLDKPLDPEALARMLTSCLG